MNMERRLRTLQSRNHGLLLGQTNSTFGFGVRGVTTIYRFRHLVQSTDNASEMIAALEERGISVEVDDENNFTLRANCGQIRHFVSRTQRADTRVYAISFTRRSRNQWDVTDTQLEPDTELETYA